MTDTSEFRIEPADPGMVKPLIGVYGRSGGGKTRSALILARGIVGPKGRITLIDTENKRGSIFKTKIEGGYNVINFNAPFTPDRYFEAFKLAAENSDIVVNDSMSHEWDGEGGILDMQEAELDHMAGNDWKKREQCKMAAWIKPKQAHKRFIQYLLRCPIPVICCLRAQEKTHMVREEGKKTQVVTDQFTTPIFDSRFIFEMLINLEVYQKDGKGGYCWITKITNEDLYPCLPDGNTQISYEHGAKIAAWCKASAGPALAPQTKPLGNPKSERNDLARQLWDHPLVKEVHQCKPEDTKELREAMRPKVNQFLLDENYISDTETLGELGVERLKTVLAKLNQKLAERTQ